MPGRFLYQKIVHRLLQINDTPESIALGAAVGMWLAMTPTVGVQMILMIIVGTVIRANRLAGCVMVYISNPLTLVPIYWGDYYVGTLLLGKEPTTYEWFVSACEGFLAEVNSIGPWPASVNFLSKQGEVAWPMVVGGAVVGLVLALPTYPITLRMVRAHQRKRAHRDSLETLREQRRLEREGDSEEVNAGTTTAEADSGIADVPDTNAGVVDRDSS